MTSLDRRSLLAALTGSAIVASCRTVSGSQTKEENNLPLAPVVRQRWIPGKDAEFKTKYIQAVTWLKANDLADGARAFPKDDPRSYLTWKKILELHQMSCEHTNWFLLPWHRLYLLYFEAACQYALSDPTFAIPYWDWSLDQEVPSEFYDIPILQENRTLQKGAKIPVEFVGKQMIEMLLINDFSSFHGGPIVRNNPFARGSEGAFESLPHNTVHNTVGGTMGNVSDSPLDPVFWLHHANIDRIWGQWLSSPNNAIEPFAHPSDDQQKQGLIWGVKELELKAFDRIVNGKYLKEHPEFIPSEIELKDIKDDSPITLLKRGVAISRSKFNRSAAISLTVNKMLASDQLPYFYDSDTAGVGPTTTLINKGKINSGALKPRINSFLQGKSSFTTNQIRVEVSVTEAQMSNLRLRVSLPQDNNISLMAANLRPPVDSTLKASTLVRFFIFSGSSGNQPDLFSENAYKSPEYVGAYSFFAVGSKHHHGGISADKATANVDITHWLARQFAQEKSKLSVITLVAVALNFRNYQPIPLFTAADKTELSLRLSLSVAL